jgi:Complex1_LYR-like
MTGSTALALYRSILKEHKIRLPPAMRKLGDEYIRSEFRAHKTAKPEQVQKFMVGWTDYLTKLRLQKGKFGANLSDNVKNSLSEEQKKKLADLKKETLKAE